MKYVFAAVLCSLALSYAQEEPETEYEAPTFDWQSTSLADLDKIAQIELSDTYVFLDGDETRRLMDLYGNFPTNTEVGLVASAENPFGWFVVFEFDSVGYVKDDDKDEIDADDILDSFREGTKQSNKARAEMGIAPLNLVGWRIEPAYEEETNNLEWCIEFDSEGTPVLNHNIRLLGRNGVTNVTLVCDPTEFDMALAETRNILTGFSYQQGQSYADYVSGDKIAEYGLAALVTGGAVAIAAKTGFLTKFLKPILVALAAIGTGAISFFKRLFGRNTEESDSPQS